MPNRTNRVVDSRVISRFSCFKSPFKMRKTGFNNIYNASVFIIVLIILTVLPRLGLCESRVKVHKELIHIQTSQQKGFIDATGQPGAIESTSPLIASIENISTHAKTNIAVSNDGSFRAIVAANPEHKIRVWARNQEGKRSYGTFSIMTSVSLPPKPTGTPAKTISGDTPPATPLTPSKNPVAPQENPPVSKNPDQTSVISPPALTHFEPNIPAPEKLNLAVIITVVNLETGQIVAAKRIAGITRIKPGQNVSFKNIVTKIIDRCTNIIKSEMTQPLFDAKKKVIRKSAGTLNSSPPAQRTDTAKPEKQKK